MSLLKFFKWDFLITIIVLIGALFYGGGLNGKGFETLTTVAILIALEIVFSFDNAGVNAKYIGKLSPFWKRMFLTVGLLIAIGFMRLLFPVLIVSISAHINPWDAWNLALDKGDVNTPGTYGYILQHAHAGIAAFGGMFLLLLFLNFLFDSEKDSHWLKWIEKPMAKAGHLDMMPLLISGLGLLAASQWLVPSHEKGTVLTAGLAGILTYTATNGLATYMENKEEEKGESLTGTTMLVGKAAFSMFLFLEVIDASFSFDGVIGAFAVTNDIILIMMGLGVGALFVRSMTIYLVEKGVLDEIEYLEHGAHWAIGTLAVMLIITMKYDIPDYVIGLIGIVFIAASIITSKREQKENLHDDDHDQPAPGIYSSHPDHALID